MRMMMKVTIPVEGGNRALAEGLLPKTMGAFMEQQKPESAYFTAQNGQRTIILDSDLRRPTVHKILGVSNSAGLTNYLLKQKSLEEVIQTTSLPTLDFMPSGKLPSSSMGVLSSAQMKELIRDLDDRRW